MVMIRRAGIGQETVVVSVDGGLEHLADWLLGVFARMHQSGAFIKEGKRIQLGWSILSFKRQSNGELLVLEPDFMGNPFVDEVSNVSLTLKIQAAQMEFADRVGVTPEITSFQEKIVLEKGCLAADKVCMTRGEPQREKADSGWFIGVQQQGAAETEFEAIYAFQLLKDRPSLFPALILPAGFMVMAGPDGIERVINPRNEVVVH